ncbi:uncharacterized protein E0L32_004961 [Thyridium curvatum]|uniref:Uncharacterized protein n=1 Tax=Thyridium curvatum TaxID=1093900 RepID=A0A507AY15_9PEZI|nr:uncharacterized protein E0L32_004961 [Thyridium curvatum]TPX14852.1 hypothetical protein E0L32_004961 [Thyridium curvatum]
MLGEFPAAGSDWTSGGGSASRTAAGDWGDRRVWSGSAATLSAAPERILLPHARPGQELVDVLRKDGGEVVHGMPDTGLLVSARAPSTGCGMALLGHLGWPRERWPDFLPIVRNDSFPSWISERNTEQV